MLCWILIYVHYFLDYAQAQQRQYNRLVKQMKPDMGKYNKLKDEV